MTDRDTHLPSSPAPASAIADAVHGVARRHGFSADAVDQLWAALVRGSGRMAQFDHPEFGGAGQWMQGGMTMVSSMFEGRLQRRVAALCDELAGIHRAAGAAEAGSAHPGSADGSAPPVPREGPADALGGPQDAPGGPGPGIRTAGPSRDAWWPAGLGGPASSGAQDGMRYAWFPEARRLVVESGGRRTVYDTGEHRIGGVSQQQGAAGGLAFASQHGPLDLARLPVVPEPPERRREAEPAPAAGTAHTPAPRRAHATASGQSPVPDPSGAQPSRTGAAHAGHPSHPDPAAPVPGDPPAARAAAVPAAAASALSHDPDRVLGLLEKLADLQARGILSAEEFAAKKTELLARL